ncbi:MAG: hypothetical protein QGI15_05165, partial [Candidatus Scalindua sp.]|nr:hypothetical protein [Candidatus Scalindua sp.]
MAIEKTIDRHPVCRQAGRASKRHILALKKQILTLPACLPDKSFGGNDESPARAGTDGGRDKQDLTLFLLEILFDSP